MRMGYKQMMKDFFELEVGEEYSIISSESYLEGKCKM